jgi:predicted ATPase
LVLIGGEAGLGKTTLAEALLGEAAEQGATVLVGGCYDLAETPPYGPWAEALGRAPAGDDLPALPAAVLPPAHDDAPLTSQDAVLRRVRDYLAALAARRPVALLLEDLHWADAASLDLLRAVARDLRARPALLLATYRDDELTRRHPLYALLPLLDREARAARLTLRRFDAESVEALVVGRYALSAADAARLVARAGGGQRLLRDAAAARAGGNGGAAAGRRRLGAR